MTTPPASSGSTPAPESHGEGAWEEMTLKMKTVFGIILPAMTMNVFSQEYHLPFAGRWFVMQGGDTLNVNQHLRVRAQWYAIDFMKVGGQISAPCPNPTVQQSKIIIRGANQFCHLLMEK